MKPSISKIINPIYTAILSALLANQICVVYAQTKSPDHEKYVALKSKIPLKDLQDTHWIPVESPLNLQGQIAYATYDEDTDETGITCRPTGRNDPLKNDSFGKFIFNSHNKLGGVFTPMYSPNGDILFKFGVIGYPYEMGILQPNTQLFHQLLNDKVDPPTPFISNYIHALWSRPGDRIAFVKGGDEMGNPAGENDVIQLAVTGGAGKTEQIIEDRNLLANSISWGLDDQIAYSVFELPPANKATLPEVAKPTVSSRLVRISDKKVIREYPNCFAPIISPDGKKIAFFAPEKVGTSIELRPWWRWNSYGLSLCVSNIDGTQRRALNRELGTYSKIFWLPNGNELIAMKNRQKGVDNFLDVTRWDVSTGKKQLLGVIHTSDYKTIAREPVGAAIRPVRLSKRGDYLIIKTLQVTRVSPRDRHFNEVILSFVAMNTKTGEVSIMAKLQDVLEADWMSLEE